MKDSPLQHTSGMQAIRRYPGPDSFKDNGIDEHLFFGRDAD
jgi:hypothetical protein